MNRTIGNIAICFSLVMWPVFSSYSHASYSSRSVSGAPLDREVFDPELYPKIQSVKDLVLYIDESFKGDKQSNEFVKYMAETISRRFYHGYSYYSTKDNWIAAVMARFVWDDLAAIVVPDDILKHPNAACSQQSIVLMACAKYYKLDYRKVIFKHHFTVEIKINDAWHYVDPNVEVIPKSGSANELMKNGMLYFMYSQKMNGVNLEELLGQPRYGSINEYAAIKTSYFQKLTSFLSSYFIFVIFIAEAFLFIWYYRKENRLS